MSVIREIGGVQEVGEDGLLLNPCRLELVAPPWRQLMELVVDAYREELGAALDGVYLRGSVPKGAAIPGVSDLDSVAVARRGASEVSPAWGKRLWDRHGERFPEIDGLEVIVLDRGELLDPEGPLRWWRFALPSQCLCVHGEDLSASLPGPRPRRPDAGRPEAITRALESFREERDAGVSDQDLPGLATWTFKHLLRCAFLLVMEREVAYTRDLYPCYRLTAEHYPERESALRTALEWAVSPPPGLDEVGRLVEELGAWILEQAAALPPVETQA